MIRSETKAIKMDLFNKLYKHIYCEYISEIRQIELSSHLDYRYRREES